MNEPIVDRHQRDRLAQSLKTLCAYHQITLQQLANETFIDYQTISRMAGNHKHAHIVENDVRVIAEYFKLKADDLLKKQIAINFQLIS